jgi:hypothetical protein
MFVRIDSIDRQYYKEYGFILKHKEIIFEYDSKTIHKIFDRYFNIYEEEKDERKKQFEEYQRAYQWIKENGYYGFHQLKIETFFENTNRNEYLIVSISSDEDELNEIVEEKEEEEEQKEEDS